MLMSRKAMMSVMFKNRGVLSAPCAAKGRETTLSYDSCPVPFSTFRSSVRLTFCSARTKFTILSSTVSVTSKSEERGTRSLRTIIDRWLICSAIALLIANECVSWEFITNFSSVFINHYLQLAHGNRNRYQPCQECIPEQDELWRYK